jgi:hypothetical protein
MFTVIDKTIKWMSKDIRVYHFSVKYNELIWMNIFTYQQLMIKQTIEVSCLFVYIVVLVVKIKYILSSNCL